MTTLAQCYRHLRYRRGRIPAYPDLGPARGIAIAILLSLPIWALVIWGLLAWLR